MPRGTGASGEMEERLSGLCYFPAVLFPRILLVCFASEGRMWGKCTRSSDTACPWTPREDKNFVPSFFWWHYFLNVGIFFDGTATSPWLVATPAACCLFQPKATLSWSRKIHAKRPTSALTGNYFFLHKAANRGITMLLSCFPIYFNAWRIKTWSQDGKAFVFLEKFGGFKSE